MLDDEVTHENAEHACGRESHPRVVVGQRGIQRVVEFEAGNEGFTIGIAPSNWASNWVSST